MIYLNDIGKHAEWLPHVDKLVIEMLANRTPPSCIQANLYAMAKVIFPNDIVVKELPSLKYIKDLRIPLYTVTKTLAAHRLGNAVNWKQLHTDETRRRQVSLVNLLIAVSNNANDKIRAICLDLAILSKDGTAEEQARAVIGVFAELATLLKDWRYTTLELFPNRPELLEAIPDPSSIDPIKMLRIQVMHDTCNTARKMGDVLSDTIINIAKERGITDANELVVLQGDCHNHMRCIIFNQVELAMGRKLEEHLREDLKLIPNNLRVSCRLGEVAIQCDKEYEHISSTALRNLERIEPGLSKVFIP